MNFTSRRIAAAFSLVEVALALGIASFCLIAVLGLVPLGVNTGQLASDQTAASSILTHVLADLRAAPMTSPPGGPATSKEYSIMIPANATGGAAATPAVLYFGNTAQQFAVSPTAVASRYRLTVNFLTPAGGRAATGVTLLVTWPAQVAPNASPSGRVQVFAGLDRN